MANEKFLLVEGIDDLHVIKHICDNCGITDIKIRDMNGIDPLLESIEEWLTFGVVGNFIGIVVDADNDLNARWDSIRQRFCRAEYTNIPEKPDPTGTIVTPPENAPLLRVGVWIMPDNKSSGALEDFLFSMVPEADVLLDYARKSVDRLPEKRFGENDEGKAIIHTWLAWQETPGRPYGTSIKSNFFNLAAPEVNTFVKWLERLFAPTP